MCLQHSLQLYLRCLHLFKMLIAVYMIVFGLIVSTDVTIHQAFGSDMLGIGIVITMMGFMKPCNIAMGHYGSLKHNKCALLIAVAFDGVVGIVQFSIGLTLFVRGAPLFDKSLRRECARHVLKAGIREVKCDEYWSDDRTAGMRLAWMSTYYRAVRDNDNGQSKILTQSSDVGECCGFGPPEACNRIENDDRFPQKFARDQYLGKDMRRKRVTCSEDRVCSGNVLCWYPEEEGTCEHFDDSDISNANSLGCKYDWGLGSCLDRGVEESSRGCAWYFEEYMNAKIYGHGITFMATLILEFFTILSGCCYCCKRKGEDILPINFVFDEPWVRATAGTPFHTIFAARRILSKRASCSSTGRKMGRSRPRKMGGEVQAPSTRQPSINLTIGAALRMSTTFSTDNRFSLQLVVFRPRWSASLSQRGFARCRFRFWQRLDAACRAAILRRCVGRRCSEVW